VVELTLCDKHSSQLLHIGTYVLI